MARPDLPRRGAAPRRPSRRARAGGAGGARREPWPPRPACYPRRPLAATDASRPRLPSCFSRAAPAPAASPSGVAAPARREAPPALSHAKASLVGLDRAGLAAALAGIGVPERQLRMRVTQVWHWLYQRGVSDFAAMTTIGKELRARLDESHSLARPAIVSEQVSRDGTRKWLLRMAPTGPRDKGAEIECVYIPEVDRGTLCISSQVGCTLTCSFCHTGTQKLVRNLTAAEIVAQVMVARDRLGDWPEAMPPEGAFVPSDGGRFITNIVLMGMGEPLYNFDNVKAAMDVVSDGEGLSVGRRRITLSTWAWCR
jgi:23S rRNA (adenine2503-C2)-methyltransferase